MSTDDGRCIKRIYGGRAWNGTRCANKAKRDGLCGIHLAARDRANTVPSTASAKADPKVGVVRKTTVTFRWEEDEGPVFPANRYESKATMWVTLSVTFRDGQDVEKSGVVKGEGYYVKSDGTPGQVRREADMFGGISSIPDAEVAAAFVREIEKAAEESAGRMEEA